MDKAKVDWNKRVTVEMTLAHWHVVLGALGNASNECNVTRPHDATSDDAYDTLALELRCEGIDVDALENA